MPLGPPVGFTSVERACEPASVRPTRPAVPRRRRARGTHVGVVFDADGALTTTALDADGFETVLAWRYRRRRQSTPLDESLDRRQGGEPAPARDRGTPELEHCCARRAGAPATRRGAGRFGQRAGCSTAVPRGTSQRSRRNRRSAPCMAAAARGGRDRHLRLEATFTPIHSSILHGGDPPHQLGWPRWSTSRLNDATHR